MKMDFRDEEDFEDDYLFELYLQGQERAMEELEEAYDDDET